MRFEALCASPCQISCRSVKSLRRYGRFSNFSKWRQLTKVHQVLHGVTDQRKLSFKIKVAILQAVSECQREIWWTLVQYLRSLRRGMRYTLGIWSQITDLTLFFWSLILTSILVAMATNFKVKMGKIGRLTFIRCLGVFIRSGISQFRFQQIHLRWSDYCLKIWWTSVQ